MSVYVFLFDQNGASVAHVSGRRPRKLVIVAVELNNIPLRGNGPSAKWKFLRVVRLPNFNFANILVRKTSRLHPLGKALSEIIGVILAHKQSLFASDYYFQPGDKVCRECTTQFLFEFTEYGSQIVRRYVFGSVDPKPRKADREKLDKIISHSLSDIIALGVQVRQVNQPPIVKDKTVCPAVEGPSAVEVEWSVGHSRKLHPWPRPCVVPKLESETLGPERTASRRVFISPVRSAGTVSWKHVVAVASHMVHDSVCVNPYPCQTTGIYH